MPPNKALRLEGTNGIFLKPKNYMINEGHLVVRKETKRPSELEGEQLMGGLIVENTSLKAYSKLAKNSANRNIIGGRR